MGSNMQRQAVPLIKREKAILQTGLEKYIAQSSNSTIFAKNSGQIKFKSCNKIIIEERSNKKIFIKNLFNNFKIRMHTR